MKIGSRMQYGYRMQYGRVIRNTVIGHPSTAGCREDTFRCNTLSRTMPEPGVVSTMKEIGYLLPNNQRQRRTCYALCHILYPVSAAHTSIFRMDSTSTSHQYHETPWSVGEAEGGGRGGGAVKVLINCFWATTITTQLDLIRSSKTCVAQG
jgi:hypothetical protein